MGKFQVILLSLTLDMGRILSIAFALGISGIPLAFWLLKKENFTKLETLIMGYTLGLVGVPALFLLEWLAGIKYNPSLIPINWTILFVAGFALWIRGILSEKDGVKKLMRPPAMPNWAAIKNAIPSLALLIIIALAVWIPLSASGGVLSEVDPYFYLDAVRQVVQTGGNQHLDDTAWYPMPISTHLGQPLYKYLLAPMYSLYNGNAVYSPFTLIATGSVYPPLVCGLAAFFIYLLFKHLYRERIGILAAGIFAFSPTILSYFQGGRAQIVPYSIFALLFFLAMFFLMVKRRTNTFAILSVIAYAAIILGSNIEILLVFCLPLFLGALALLHVFSPSEESRQLNRVLMVFLAGLVLVQLVNLAYAGVSSDAIKEAAKGILLPVLPLAVPLLFDALAERQNWPISRTQRVQILLGAVLIIVLLAPNLPVLGPLLDSYRFWGSYSDALTRTISEQQSNTVVSFDSSFGALGMTLDAKPVILPDSLASSASGTIDSLAKFHFVDMAISGLAFLNAVPTAIFNLFYNSISNFLNIYLTKDGIAGNFPVQERVNSLATLFLTLGPVLLAASLLRAWRKEGQVHTGALLLLAFLLPVTFMGMMKSKFMIYATVAFVASTAAFVGELEPLVRSWAGGRKISGASGAWTIFGWSMPGSYIAACVVVVMLLAQFGWPAVVLMDRGWAISSAYVFGASVMTTAMTPTFYQNPTRGMTVLNALCQNGTYPAGCAAIADPNTTLNSPVAFYRQDYCVYSIWPHPDKEIPASMQDAIGYRCSELGGSWIDAMDWIDTNVPHTERITSWWDYGHWTNFLGGANTVLRPDQASHDMIGRVANAYLQNDTANLIKVMKAYGSHYALMDVEIVGSPSADNQFQFGAKYSALDYLGCDWANQTHYTNPELDSQCEMDHQPEQIMVPLAQGEAQTCVISESTQSSGLVAHRLHLTLGAAGGAPTTTPEPAYCVRLAQLPDNQIVVQDAYMLDQRNSTGDLLKAPAAGWFTQNSVLPPFYAATADRPIFAAIYSKTPYTTANGTVVSSWDYRRGPYYDSPLYQGFFLRHLDGFDLVFDNNYVRIYKMQDAVWNSGK